MGDVERDGELLAEPAGQPAGDAAAGGAGRQGPVAGPVPSEAVDGSGVQRVARRRRRAPAARRHPVMAKFTDEEWSVLVAAAGRAGLTPTSFVASSAVGVARGEVAPLPASTGDVVRELVAVRTQLVRYGTLLNQAVARLNATGERDESLTAAVQRCQAATVGVGEAVERLGRRR